MARRKRAPLIPTAAEVAAIRAGPKKNRTAMVEAATVFPQAMIFGCNAMNKPTIPHVKNVENLIQ